jgi:hypothetical protein
MQIFRNRQLDRIFCRQASSHGIMGCASADTVYRVGAGRTAGRSRKTSARPSLQLGSDPQPHGKPPIQVIKIPCSCRIMQSSCERISTHLFGVPGYGRLFAEVGLVADPSIRFTFRCHQHPSEHNTGASHYRHRDLHHSCYPTYHIPIIRLHLSLV